MELTKREQEILRETRERLTKWGRHADIPATPHELAHMLLKYADESMSMLDCNEAIAVVEQQNAELKEQLTLANRQLGAAKARETKLRQQQENS